MSGLNANPIIYHTKSSTRSITSPTSISTSDGHGPILTTFYTEEKSINEDEIEQIDALEIFDMLRNINDPEHPLTLEQLNVAQLDQINVDHNINHIRIRFTPTIPHCSMATLIGLCLRVKLIRSLPPRYKIDISISPGTHASEDAVNKQLSDKERVAAALENTHLLDVVNKCIAHTDPIPEEIQTLLQ